MRSFCTAANELGLGQPTVTTHIRKLERDMGIELFDRATRPIRLTPAGTALVDLAAPLIDGIYEFVESTVPAEQESVINFATTNDMVAHTLLRAVTVFRPTLSAVTLESSGRVLI